MKTSNTTKKTFTLSQIKKGNVEKFAQQQKELYNTKTCITMIVMEDYSQAKKEITRRYSFFVIYEDLN